MATNYLALDVGRVRIGVALANDIARIAAPLTTLINGVDLIASLTGIINEQQVTELIVGWPRGLNGQETEQTRYVAAFVEQLKQFNLPIHTQDEALTSVKAEQELQQRGKPYVKADIDSLSAVYILDDYLAEGVN